MATLKSSIVIKALDYNLENGIKRFFVLLMVHWNKIESLYLKTYFLVSLMFECKARSLPTFNRLVSHLSSKFWTILENVCQGQTHLFLRENVFTIFTYGHSTKFQSD